MKSADKAINVIISTFFFLWPFLVFIAIRKGQFRFVICLAAILIAIRLLFAIFGKKQEDKNHRILINILSLCLLIAALVLDKDKLALWYPVLVNASFLYVFGSSLLGVPIIERMARLKSNGRPLSPAVVSYTRKVTLIWTIFFIVNGLIAVFTVLNGNLELWTLYNGFLSYVAIGLLFAAEYLYRKKVLHV